jgi:hypothetical protein
MQAPMGPLAKPPKLSKPVTFIPQWYLQAKAKQEEQKQGELLSGKGLSMFGETLKTGQSSVVPTPKKKKPRTEKQKAADKRRMIPLHKFIKEEKKDPLSLLQNMRIHPVTVYTKNLPELHLPFVPIAR